MDDFVTQILLIMLVIVLAYVFVPYMRNNEPPKQEINHNQYMRVINGTSNVCDMVNQRNGRTRR